MGCADTQTSNLDGETNLKIRKALERTWEYITADAASELRGTGGAFVVLPGGGSMSSQQHTPVPYPTLVLRPHIPRSQLASGSTKGSPMLVTTTLTAQWPKAWLRRSAPVLPFLALQRWWNVSSPTTPCTRSRATW